jgi:two-component system, cell cycle sensor histidine kinase and response regulator CckA
MLKDSPAGPSFDRSQRYGSPVLLLVVTLVVVGSMLSLALLDEHHHITVLTLFLTGFAALGVLAAFLYAVGILQFAGSASRNDITKAVVDGAEDGQLVLDREGKVLYANAVYQALCGGVPGRVASIRPVERLFSGGSDVSEAIYRLAQAAREGRGATEIIRLVPALIGGGSFGWYRVRVRPLARGTGDTAVHWRVTDVTRDREKHENDFQELQQAISYLDSAPAGFFSARPEGRVLYLNATLADWLEYDLAEIGNRNLEIRDIIASGGEALLAQVQGQPGAVRTETIDLDLRRKGGQRLPVRLLHRVAFAADGTAGVSRTLVLNRSAEAGGAEGLRDAEVRFARLFNTSPFAIATLGRSGRIESTNARFAGFLPSQQPAGPRDLLSLIAPADRAKIETAFAAAHEGAGDSEPVDVALAGEGGRQARFFFVPSGTSERGEEAVIAYALETTDEKKLQEQLFQSMKMNAVGQLAGGVAHDFNNHLQAIVGFADLLAGNFRATDPRHQDVMQIKNSANRAKSLVRQLLAFSRQQTLLPETIDLGERLGDLNAMLKRSIGANVELDIRHGRDLWATFADPASFDNMIINLAVNARDAMPEGGRLTIRTANVPAAESESYNIEGLKRGDYVLVDVTDTGTGMSPEVRRKIFEPFFTTKEVGRGTGLGLSSVYGFVTQSNGSIDCLSELGKGTTFRIFLPRHVSRAGDLLPGGNAVPVDAAPPAEKHAPEATEPAAAPPASDKAPLADLTGTGTILLVEDEDAVRNFGARALRSRGYTVIEAQSGVDALTQLETHALADIDLVVSDVVMPEMDGPSLLRELRARKPEIRVIFVSGYAEEAFRKNLPEGQQFDFLPKPFSLKQLIEAVKS